MVYIKLPYTSYHSSSMREAMQSLHENVFVFQGDFASQNMMRSIARQVCEQLVNSEQNVS